MTETARPYDASLTPGRQEPRIRTRGHRAGHALLGLVLVASLGGCSLFGASPAPTTSAASPSIVSVPDVVGQGLKQATQTLVDGGLTTGTITNVTSDKPVGTVLEQSPAAGSQAAMGTPVVLTIATSGAQNPVPDLVGKTAVEAANALLAAELAVGTVTRKSSDQKPGVVLAQTPAAGAIAVKGSPVDLTVSDGQVSVPSLSGLSQADATTVLAALGLTAGTVTVKSSPQAPGTVIGQSPAPATVVAPGSAVALTTANGSTTVPSLVGKTAADAANALLGAGLKVGAVTKKASNQPAGEILSQSPASGSSAAVGSAVAVTVAEGTGNVAVPDVTGMPQATASNVLIAVGLTLGAVKDTNSDQPPTTVLSQSPPPAQQVPPGTKVDVTVSNGLAAVPDVVGKTEAEATAALTDAGFVVAVQKVSAQGAAGTVVAQDPPAGSQLAQGKTVVLSVGS